ncbi:MAG: T9SS type A sorting domain-containing protein [Saprospiraceae bacterium]|nr:T9SS type A sorting domain-containing protein [Saprospiraceae bacterium]
MVGTRQTIVEHNIYVYPNPTNGHFFIENKMPSEPLEVEVWDGVGRRVFTEKTKAVERSEFDVSHLVNGVYCLKIRVLDAFVTRRLILMK